MNDADTSTAAATTSPAAKTPRAAKRVGAQKRLASAPKLAKSTGKGHQPHTQKRRKDSNASGRAGTKSARILGLIRRPAGATLAAIMKATGWQAHSVRGFLSTAPKRYQIQIESVKNETGERVYRAAK